MAMEKCVEISLDLTIDYSENPPLARKLNLDNLVSRLYSNFLYTKGHKDIRYYIEGEKGRNIVQARIPIKESLKSPSLTTRVDIFYGEGRLVLMRYRPFLAEFECL